MISDKGSTPRAEGVNNGHDDARPATPDDIVLERHGMRRIGSRTLLDPEMENIGFRERVAHRCIVAASSAGTFALGVMIDVVQDYRLVAVGVAAIVAVGLFTAAIVTERGTNKIKEVTKGNWPFSSRIGSQKDRT